MTIKQWLEANAWWVGLVSLVLFFGSLWVLKILVVRMNSDYFVRPERPVAEGANPIARVLAVVGKNALGLALLLIGIAMLFVPGQGLLTMLFGISLMDFPGKRAMEIWLIRRPKVNRALNWIRSRNDREPLEIPESGGIG